MSKVLVCGGRDFKDEKLLFSTLDLFNSKNKITLIIQGYAGKTLNKEKDIIIGADRLADKWARINNIPSTGRLFEVTNEMWNKQGKAAGFIRNKRMLLRAKPHYVIAFQGGNGTLMMVNLALSRDIPVVKVKWT